MGLGGQRFKLAPDHNNPDDYILFHKLHPDLFVYRTFGLLRVEFVLYESLALGGDQRLYPDSLGKAKVTVPYMTQAALAAIKTHVGMTENDAEVTVRLWNKQEFDDYSANMQYIPPADQNTNFCEVFEAVFDFINVRPIA